MDKRSRPPAPSDNAHKVARKVFETLPKSEEGKRAALLGVFIETRHANKWQYHVQYKQERIASSMHRTLLRIRSVHHYFRRYSWFCIRNVSIVQAFVFVSLTCCSGAMLC